MNMNYYYDKYIRKLYKMDFVELMDWFRWFIINFGERFIFFKYVMKILYCHSLKDAKKALLCFNKKKYVVETKLQGTLYSENTIYFDHLFAQIIYKSLFFKKNYRLSLRSNCFIMKSI